MQISVSKEINCLLLYGACWVLILHPASQMFCTSSAEQLPWKKQKLLDIHQALNSDPVDIETLRRAAVSEGGLLTDDIRRKVWPKLLSINVYSLPAKPCKCVFECLERTTKTPTMFTFSYFPLSKPKMSEKTTKTTDRWCSMSGDQCGVSRKVSIWYISQRTWHTITWFDTLTLEVHPIRSEW